MRSGERGWMSEQKKSIHADESRTEGRLLMRGDSKTEEESQVDGSGGD